MTLRLVGGKSKGIKLKGPKSQGIRPAAARVRKSLFDILGDLKDQQVLDLFAGTGSMGLEALSRGAASSTFVDKDQHAITLLFTNLKKMQLLPRAHVLKDSASQAIQRLYRMKKRYDLIFLDPPYDQGWIDRCLKALEKYPLLKPGALLLCEHSPREIPTFFGGLEKVDERKYGQTLVSFFRNKES